MENTLENKRVFFNTYLGAKNILHNREIAGLREVTNQIDDVELEKSELFLKPLKNITPEHLLELHFLLKTGFNFKKLEYQGWFFVIGIAAATAMFFVYANMGRYGNDEKTELVMRSLREKGYAIGFNNIPVCKMVEYGWIALND